MPPHDGLVHPSEELDIKDTNVALIGSDIDHRVKHASAATEPAWNDGRVGVKPGLFVWRIEDFAVVAVAPTQVGTFYDGDSYIVLHSVSVKQSQPGSGGASDPSKLLHDIFFWLGAHTSQDEAGTAAYKTVELDEFLGGAAAQHRELQGAMSDGFAALFPRLTLRRGGVRSGFRHVEAGVAETDKTRKTLTLLRVFKHPVPHARDGVVVHEVEPNWRSLDDEDVFVLDVGDKIWVWQGARSGPMEKARAAQAVADLTLAKHLDVEVLTQTEGRARRVVELLGGTPEDVDGAGGFKKPRPTVSAPSPAGGAARQRRLFRLTDSSGKLAFEPVKDGGAISREDLDGKDMFLLDDAGKAIWVWEGQGASKAERTIWLRVAQAYVAQAPGEDAHLTPIAKVLEGHESPAFLKAIAAH